MPQIQHDSTSVDHGILDDVRHILSPLSSQVMEVSQDVTTGGGPRAVDATSPGYRSGSGWQDRTHGGWLQRIQFRG